VGPVANRRPIANRPSERQLGQVYLLKIATTTEVAITR
jgi:hypothetical protein